MPPLSADQTYEGLPLETRIPGFRVSTVPVSGRTGEDTVYSSTARYRLEEPVSVLGVTQQARESRLGAEVEDEAHRQGHQGFRGVSTPLYRWLSQQISQLYRVRFCYLAYGQECYLILVRHIHSSLYQL